MAAVSPYLRRRNRTLQEALRDRGMTSEDLDVEDAATDADKQPPAREAERPVDRRS